MQIRNSAIAERAAPDRAALSGIRVLDLADNAVAYASRLLADLGAEVIRIEPPRRNAIQDGIASCAHAFWNANKKAITLDLNCAEGRRLFGELLVKSDV